MNSTISDDSPGRSHEHLASETSKWLSNILNNSKNVISLHKELLEFNLSITAYIEESKRRLEGLRLDLAHAAPDSCSVVDVLTDKSENFKKQRNWKCPDCTIVLLSSQRREGNSNTPIHSIHAAESDEEYNNVTIRRPTTQISINESELSIYALRSEITNIIRTEMRAAIREVMNQEFAEMRQELRSFEDTIKFMNS